MTMLQPALFANLGGSFGISALISNEQSSTLKVLIYFNFVAEMCVKNDTDSGHLCTTLDLFCYGAGPMKAGGIQTVYRGLV
jgi:hypothetical protein